MSDAKTLDRLSEIGASLADIVEALEGQKADPEVAAALAEIAEALQAGPDFAALCRDVRRRRFGAELPAEWKERARQSRFLQYRGFSSDHIRSAFGPDFDPEE